MTNGVLNREIEMMHQLVDSWGLSEQFTGMIHGFIEAKSGEITRSRWGKITKVTHWIFGGDSPQIHQLAAITELIMLAADIADDLQDQDNMEQVWMQMPREQVWNAVLALLTGALAEVGRVSGGPQIGDNALVVDVSTTILQSLNGQYDDLAVEMETDHAYVAMVQKKSGSLLQLACRLGIAGLSIDKERWDKLSELAICVGVMAQIDNDIRDVLRYDLKNDLVMKKRTLPVFYLLAEGDEGFQPILQYYEGQLSKDKMLSYKEACVEHIKASGCIEYCQVIQQLFRERAEGLFEGIAGQSPWKQEFREIMLGECPTV